MAAAHPPLKPIVVECFCCREYESNRRGSIHSGPGHAIKIGNSALEGDSNWLHRVGDRALKLLCTCSRTLPEHELSNRNHKKNSCESFLTFSTVVSERWSEQKKIKQKEKKPGNGCNDNDGRWRRDGFATWHAPNATPATQNATAMRSKCDARHNGR